MIVYRSTGVRKGNFLKKVSLDPSKTLKTIFI